MKKKIHTDDPYITVSQPNKNTIALAINEEGCKFLIDELQYLLENKEYIFDYDKGTGYDCGILSKDSLGLIMVRKDFN